tara:strand:+ start:2793 stop:3554 length:762 start_codon:yes stop_codon:yes gene_type:complete
MKISEQTLRNMIRTQLLREFQRQASSLRVASADFDNRRSSDDGGGGDEGDWSSMGGKMGAPCSKGGKSNTLGDCDTEFGKKVQQVVDAVNKMHKSGDLKTGAKINTTWRSAACQKAKFCSGRSAKRSPSGRHVSTDASGTPKATAADIVADHSEPYDPPDKDKFWNAVGDEAKKLGLTWGGDWTGFPDRPHIQTKNNPYASATNSFIEKELGIKVTPGMWPKDRCNMGCENLPPSGDKSRWQKKYAAKCGSSE